MLLQRIDLEYSVESAPRYGHGKPVHPRLAEILDRRRGVYAQKIRQWLRQMAGFEFQKNDFLTVMDAFALYATLALQRPARYLEVGSGQSTRYARLSIERHGLPTQIISIDPSPRAEIDAICDHVIRRPLEEVDLAIFEKLERGDIVFIDNSHRALMNSDVVVTFLDVLPRLCAGVALHIHDIFLPSDYPESWAPRGYSEQYLLAAYLLGGGARLAPMFPAAHVTHDPELFGMLTPLWERYPDLEHHGASFWAEIE